MGKLRRIPEVSWQWLQENYGFTGPQQPGKELPWWLEFEGDLHWLDLRDCSNLSDIPEAPLRKKGARYFVRGAMSIQTRGGNNSKRLNRHLATGRERFAWPRFKCLHAHCSQRGLRELLEWAENQEKGIVDRFCSQSRVWRPGQLDEKGRPRILHPSALDGLIAKCTLSWDA